MVENQSRATLIMFGLVAVIIVVGMAIKLQPVTEEAQATGAKLAKVWMLDSVQRYHQAWLVQGEPNRMEMDGFQLTMTEGGLVSPFRTSGVLDCDYWLTVHYPQRKIMASELLEIRGAIKSNSYTCNYTYENGQRVVVISDANYLKIDVEMSTE
ncbi:MSHA biogenesis protein MshF [Vibrio parahaemolyticus]|uniref:MSHA biogenesis protein MshF n=1 Tax=Vibrio parahaemolyticus TaxID=670 RepID=UPI0008137492|nr:MSHA biogenesis protein MshF [Vibrio parahaemolyticus]EGQ8309941.1 MSHA biogenesis protein MshF [Vibrio parahaemolyticus]EGQ8852138.1 MSHA biogenesis protein MshF [Vibrio parahaemolyticus]EGQ8856850.1 MSHA biogenesis protein MshF [Vibrio parahaemolyticus]EGQ8876251.1 MSHA biogenesis protein MshF [Vibrio parahaemolyticus]EGQ8995531.1 MSHA biogenesis protein MshF [Vibrio parahaemolyticus]